MGVGRVPDFCLRASEDMLADCLTVWSGGAGHSVRGKALMSGHSLPTNHGTLVRGPGPSEMLFAHLEKKAVTAPDSWNCCEASRGAEACVYLS